MKSLMRTASRGALIALIAAAPVAGFAATDANANASGKLMTEEPADSASVDTEVTTDTESSTDVAATGDTDEGDEPLVTDEKMDIAEAADDVNSSDIDQAADRVNSGDVNLANDEEMAGDEQTEMAQAETAQPVDGQITMQDENSILAEDLLGATVYNSADENVGDINDLIIGLDGNVKGIVIGVGGFLGLGEKQVALEMAALDVVDREAGMPRLMTSASKADLEAAPEFVSARDQASAQQMEEMQSSTDTMGGVQPTE